MFKKCLMFNKMIDLTWAHINSGLRSVGPSTSAGQWWQML